MPAGAIGLIGWTQGTKPSHPSWASFTSQDSPIGNVPFGHIQALLFLMA